MKRLHVRVSVKDLPDSIRFYRTLFGAEPVLTQFDYAKWMLDDPRVNFAISMNRHPVGVNHLGFQLESDEELRGMRAQLEAADARMAEENEQPSCCAKSDKYWVTDPAGSRIPVYGEDTAVFTRPTGRMERKMKPERTYNVLFLCTGNSARSILAESLLNSLGKGRFQAFSAGSFPKGQVHPLAVDLLKRTNLPSEGCRSKSWDEFAAPTAPPIDFVFTVCDNAAGEACPIWPCKPMTAHWGIADPAAAEGTDTDRAFAFRKALKELETRIKLFLQLPISSLDQMTLREKLRAIGQQSTTTEA